MRPPAAPPPVRGWVEPVLLLLIFLFLLSFFDPRLLLSDTTPAGGDTPSHFVAADQLRNFFLNHGQITGWDYGNLSGFPLFQYYFPLPFLACVVLSLVLPLSISFKLITVLGLFLLPVSVLHLLRRLGFPFPVPIVGASGSLAFLFVESQSMWGGNILSTLAGEFTYSLGMSLSLLYLAEFHRGIQTGKGAGKNAVLLALTGFSHGCALLVAGAVPFYYLICGRDTWARLVYYLKVNLLAFLMLAFWLVPWLLTQEYMTAFNFRWKFGSPWELAPTILIPFYGLAAFSAIHTGVILVRRRFRAPEPEQVNLLYLWFAALVCLVYFDVGYRLNVVDIRFIPFIQLFVVLIACVFLGRLLGKIPVSWPFAVATLLVCMVWADSQSRAVRSWVKWNYEGFEVKPRWPLLRDLLDPLKGDAGDPRVIYEHSARHDQFGSVRTFESLPYFTGRSTLEGLYLQSSINSPFIFYLQSEVSRTPSCPLPEYDCSPLDLDGALRHLSLFNVSHLVLRSDEAKEEARSIPSLTLEHSTPPLEIHRLPNAPGYVSPLPCRPILYTGPDWKQEAYRWFVDYQPDSVPVVIGPGSGEEPGRFARISEVFPSGERCQPRVPACQMREFIEHDRIRILTDCIGDPLLIRMSYHPRWRVTGADGPYLVTPGFMLIFPHDREVVLRFGWSGANYLGSGLTLLVLLGGATGWVGVRRSRAPVEAAAGESTLSPAASRILKTALVALAILVYVLLKI